MHRALTKITWWAYLLLETWSFVNFQMRNEHLMTWWAHLLLEKRLFVDFQMRNEQFIRWWAHLWLEKWSFVNFQMRNEHMSSSRSEVGAILRTLTIFKQEVSVCMTVSGTCNFFKFTYHGHVKFTQSILCWFVAMLWSQASRQFCKF